MSATATQEEQDECFLHGMHFFCGKPVDTKVLRIILDVSRESEGGLQYMYDSVVTKVGEAIGYAESETFKVASAAIREALLQHM